MLARSIFEKQGQDLNILKYVLSMVQTSTYEPAIFEQLALSSSVLGASCPMSGTMHSQYDCSCELKEEVP